MTIKCIRCHSDDVETTNRQPELYLEHYLCNVCQLQFHNYDIIAARKIREKMMAVEDGEDTLDAVLRRGMESLYNDGFGLCMQFTQLAKEIASKPTPLEKVSHLSYYETLWQRQKDMLS